MKNQYFGDINDYRKYGLLRCIQKVTGAKLGVCWMLTEDDGGRDGNKRSYLAQHREYRQYDPELFDTLTRVDGPRFRHVRFAEKWMLLPKTDYFTDVLYDDTERESYFRRAADGLKDSSVIFFDPDNGLEVKSVLKGRKGSSKYLYYDELTPFTKTKKHLLIYQHFPRVNRERYIASRTAVLQHITGAASVLSFRTSHVVFFLTIPRQSPYPITRLQRTVAEAWEGQFTVSRI